MEVASRVEHIAKVCKAVATGMERAHRTAMATARCVAKWRRDADARAAEAATAVKAMEEERGATRGGGSAVPAEMEKEKMECEPPPEAVKVKEKGVSGEVSEATAEVVGVAGAKTGASEPKNVETDKAVLDTAKGSEVSTGGGRGAASAVKTAKCSVPRPEGGGGAEAAADEERGNAALTGEGRGVASEAKTKVEEVTASPGGGCEAGTKAEKGTRGVALPEQDADEEQKGRSDALRECGAHQGAGDGAAVGAPVEGVGMAPAGAVAACRVRARWRDPGHCCDPGASGGGTRGPGSRGSHICPANHLS